MKKFNKHFSLVLISVLVLIINILFMSGSTIAKSVSTDKQLLTKEEKISNELSYVPTIPELGDSLLVQAANTGERNGDKFVTGGGLSKEGGRPVLNGEVLEYNKEYLITYEWLISDVADLKGDPVLYFSIPPEMIVDGPFEFTVNNATGNTIGNAVVDGDNEFGYYIKMTLTTYGLAQSYLEGEFNLITHVNRSYVKEGKDTIKFPGFDLDVEFPSQEEGPGGDGAGFGSPTSKDKEGKLVYGESGQRHIEWLVVLGYDVLLGDTFNSIDEIESIILTDKPVDQKFISVQEAWGWDSGYAYNKLFWNDYPWAYDITEKDKITFEQDTNGNDIGMTIDLKPELDNLEKLHKGEPFNDYRFEYITVPIDPNVDAEMTNDATVVVTGKNGHKLLPIKLKNKVKWSSGGGSASGNTGNAKLIKTDSETGDRLEDAEFDLYHKVDGVWELENKNLVTNQNGEISVGNLKIGEYEFRETEAPPGYDIPEGQNGRHPFEITKDDIKGEIEIQVEAENTKSPDPLGSAKLIKTDIDTGEGLQGAIFDLFKFDEESKEWEYEERNLKTKENGELSVTDLKLGKYTFLEVEAPEGYILPEYPDNRHDFEITSSNVDVEQIVEVKNRKIPDRELLFTKLDNNNQPIKQSDSSKQAEFHLEVKNGSTWSRANQVVYRSNANGEINLIEDDFKNLDADKSYRFKEVKAPYGYELPTGNDIYSEEFYLEKYSVTPDSITKTNKLLNPSIKFKKTIEFNTGTNTPTSSQGIEFVIQGRTTGNWIRYSTETFTTNNNGEILIDNTSHPGLIQGMVDSNYQQFRFRESKVPAGRGLQDPKYPNNGIESDGPPGSDFSVAIPIAQIRDGTNQGNNVVIDNLTLENMLIRYNMTLTKVDSINKDRLDGAEFTIYEKDQPTTAKVVTGTNGLFEIEDLIIGKEYVIKETKSPEGYGARSDEFIIQLDLTNQMKVSKKDEKGNIVVLTEGQNGDYLWDGQTLKLNFAVENTAIPKIPMTGGSGMTYYTLFSLLFLSFGFVLYMTIKRGERR